MVKINMMCGKRDWTDKGWISIDQAPFKHIRYRDIYLSNQFDNSVDLIYCSHGIGYSNTDELDSLFGEWFKKLRPGGVLRIATPDFDILSKMYQVGVDMDKLIGPLMGRMEVGVNGAHIYHKSLWDEKKLTALLTDAGFINVRRYDHTKTCHPNTGNREDFFDDHSSAYINGTLISLNMECTKQI